ncbi:hypothetical protein GCM10023321_79840 [Pseudonocardia eucalypti]|uniref:OmpR/PhoB-type domain-containing protein n=1 Tax=Pseudonocardia eucalypti TaxID=648755 RepID=A0ABP9RC44_9PSEU|nr:DNA-binding response OmpR family regulator [Pseudonocardia eucalypti]
MLVEDSAELSRILADLLDSDQEEPREGALSRGIILFDIDKAGPDKTGRLGRLLDGIERIARRTTESPKQVVEYMDVTIDLEQRTIRAGNERPRLTVREFEVLAVLARRAGHAVSRGEILEDVWGIDTPRTSRILAVHMTSLRAKIKRPELIETVHGFGYRLSATSS